MNDQSDATSNATVVTPAAGANSSPSDKERRSFKKNLSVEQIEALEKHFVIEPMPKRKTKLELAEKLKIRDEDLNRWFQFKRNKVKALKKAAEAQRIAMRKLHMQQNMHPNGLRHPMKARLPHPQSKPSSMITRDQSCVMKM